MIPTLLVAEIVKEGLRFVNNLLEGTPIEQRKATSILWFNTTWPIIKGAFSPEVQKQVEDVMKGVN